MWHTGRLLISAGIHVGLRRIVLPVYDASGWTRVVHATLPTVLFDDDHKHGDETAQATHAAEY